MSSMYLLQLENYSIHAQLQLEEALLRADNRNWCLINHGSSPAIVMGISGKPEELLHQDAVLEKKIPVIRRFSGGGTVIVDHNTFFVTFICNAPLLSIPLQPQSIMQWSEIFYKNVFTHDQFRLRENDYVIGGKKFGGNAQYLRKERWLHHTSFLWDYESASMDLLKMPQKQPSYRNKRPHNDFLCRLRDHHTSREEVLIKIKNSLHLFFDVSETHIGQASLILSQPHRRSTEFIDLQFS